MTTTIAQGATGELSAQFLTTPGGSAIDLDANPTITITPMTGGAAVIGPTSTGVTHPGTGLYGYAWNVGASQAVGSYAIVWNGLASSAAVVATEVAAVTAAQDANHWYASLADVKAALGVSDTSRNDLIGACIGASSRMIDKLTGRVFWLADDPVAQVVDPAGRIARRSGGQILLIPDVGDLTGFTLEYGSVVGTASWTEYDSTTYSFEPAYALESGEPVTGVYLPSGLWPVSSSVRVRITARWGWPSIPDDVAMACQIQASRLFKRKDSPEGVLGSAEWGSIRLPRVDADVAALLGPYHLLGVA